MGAAATDMVIAVAHKKGRRSSSRRPVGGLSQVLPKEEPTQQHARDIPGIQRSSKSNGVHVL